jgi:monoamine oxidase
MITAAAAPAGATAAAAALAGSRRGRQRGNDRRDRDRRGPVGLYAAHLLEAEGARVVVAEGRQRVGGRLFTLDDVPGHPEAGGNGIGAGYARIIDMAKNSGSELIPVRQRTETTLVDSLINLRGTNIKQSEWATSPLNPFPAGRRDKMPWAYAGDYYLKLNPLKEGDTWTDPRFREWDISLYDFLKRQGGKRGDARPRPAHGDGLRHQPVRFLGPGAVPHLRWGAQQLAFGREGYAIAAATSAARSHGAKRLKGDLTPAAR